jgi:hypothetical protein
MICSLVLLYRFSPYVSAEHIGSSLHVRNRSDVDLVQETRMYT